VEKITIDSLGIGMAMLFQGNEASKKAVPCGAAFFGVLLFLRLLLGSKSVEDTDRNQLGDILALEEDLFDVGRGDKGLITMRHQIDHLDIRRQEFVDFMQLELRFVVGDSPQASYQSLRAQFTGLLDGPSVDATSMSLEASLIILTRSSALKR
jgi:hypothetical protein